MDDSKSYGKSAKSKTTPTEKPSTKSQRDKNGRRERHQENEAKAAAATTAPSQPPLFFCLPCSPEPMLIISLPIFFLFAFHFFSFSDIFIGSSSDYNPFCSQNR
jgi:hypothetical protein